MMNILILNLIEVKRNLRKLWLRWDLNLSLASIELPSRKEKLLLLALMILMFGRLLATRTAISSLESLIWMEWDNKVLEVFKLINSKILLFLKELKKHQKSRLLRLKRKKLLNQLKSWTRKVSPLTTLRWWWNIQNAQELRQWKPFARHKMTQWMPLWNWQNDFKYGTYDKS